MLVLNTHNTATPVSAEFVVVIELFSEAHGEGFQILEVLSVDLGESNGGCGLHVDELSEVGLSSDEAVWHVLSSAESWEVDNSLDWVDVVGNDN